MRAGYGRGSTYRGTHSAECPISERRTDRRSYVLSRTFAEVSGKASDGPLGWRAGSYQATVPACVAMTGRHVVRRTTGGCQAVIGPVPSSRSCQRGSARKVSRAT